LFEDGFGEKGDNDAEEAAGDGEEQCFTEKHLDDVEPGETGALRMPISRVRSRIMVCMFIRTTRKLMTMPSRPWFCEGFQFGQIGGVHERDVFGHGADAILRIELKDFGAGGFGVALAADENHGNVIFRADDVLPGFQGNGKSARLCRGQRCRRW